MVQDLKKLEGFKRSYKLTKALCKKCRREGVKLFTKGEKCVSPRCPFDKKSYGPGRHGAGSQRRRVSEYGEQLREKQKVKQIYIVREKQFRNYFEKASKSENVTGEILLRLLEQRLDNVVYRLGLADSRRYARQIVSHAHIKVNEKKVNIASYQVKAGDEISISPKFKKTIAFKKLSEKISSYKPVDWLKLDAKNAKGKIIREPQREDVDANINENLIVEFYSR